MEAEPIDAEEQGSKLSADERHALERFRDVSISLEELRRVLTRRMQFNFEGDEIYTRGFWKTSAPAQPGVQVAMKHVRNAYHRWRGGSIKDRELRDWAAMLTMCDDYDLDEADPEHESIVAWLNVVAIPSEPIPNIDPC